MGVFKPNKNLPVSADLDPASKAVAVYNSGESIPYDSYIKANEYVWISYVAISGKRRYVAVGPDDGRADTTWGRGFFN